MPKRTKSYRDALLEDLKDPAEAAHYLNAAFEDSEETFLAALRDVVAAQPRPMNEIASNVGISRESLYRLTNPTFSSLSGVLGAIGLRIKIEPV